MANYNIPIWSHLKHGNEEMTELNELISLLDHTNECLNRDNEQSRSANATSTCVIILESCTKRVVLVQCDQIWRFFATLTKS